MFIDGELHGDPKQQHAANNMHVRQREKLHNHSGEYDAQEHCRAGAKNDAPASLLLRQRAAGHRDHDRVVAGKEKIDPDDLQHLQCQRAYA